MISDEFKKRVLFYKKNKSVRLTHRDKQELKAFYKDELNQTLNVHCNSCVKKGLEVLFNHLNEEQTPEAKGVSSLEKMSMNELRDLAKELGYKNARSKEQLIKNIEDEIKA